MSIDRETLLETAMTAVRKTNDRFKEEVKLAMDAAFDDMEDAGVNIDCESHESKICQAVILYVKGTFGYHDGSEKFLSMYEKLRDSLASTTDAGVHVAPVQQEAWNG